MHSYFLAKKNEKKIGSIWANQRNIWVGEQVRRESWRTMPATKRWDLTSTKDFQEWFTYGNGLPDSPSKSGRYTLESSGEKAVADVFPAGVFPHLLSDKHAGRFTSPDFHLDGEHDLYLQVTGSGSASARYVVQNYPRKGTVYPETVFGGEKGKDGWRWQQYDLAYWNGDDIHIEMANAKDAPLMVKPKDRSWFGIRSAILLKKGAEGPSGDSLEHIDPLFTVAGDESPKSLRALATLHQRALRDSITKWAADKSTDSIALHLNAAVKEGLLPNTVTALKHAAPLIQQYRKLEAEIKSPTRVPGLDEWIGHDQALFEQGNHKKPTKAVPRRFLDAIDPSPWKTKTSGRRELADHLLADGNPFTTRVITNRIWLHLFGKGIVPTADNFGRLGESPTHPELLDFLATKFSDEHDWSIKKMIREIVMSKTWMQSSQPSSVASSDDPDNAWLSHFPVNRLEAESIRDALLSTSGNLDRSLFGPPINGKSPRRSVYVNIIRNRLDPFLSVYNAPVPFSSTGRRSVTNVPAQSLTMLNDPFVLNAASKFAESSGGEKNQVNRIASMWKKALARPPLAEESKSAQNFVNQLREKGQTINKERNGIEQQLNSLKDNRETLLSTARSRLNNASPKPTPGNSVLKPIAEWKFEGNGKDRFGNADLKLNGSARIEGGALILDGKGFASTPPLSSDLKEKTLEAIVELSTLDQRGGGVMTVQNTGGGVFDSIVFSEKRPNHWLAGSDGFRRTVDFDGTPDKVAASEAVHLAIVYQADGTIQGFRNGRPYGNAYKSKGITTFKKSASQILFGLRHGTAVGGNRMLKGKILEARLYDRALSGDEAKAASSGLVNFISKSDVLAALNQKDKTQLKQWDKEIRDLESRLKHIGPGLSEKEVWQNLAHSIYNLKEFIYVY